MIGAGCDSVDSLIAEVAIVAVNDVVNSFEVQRRSEMPCVKQ